MRVDATVVPESHSAGIYWELAVWVLSVGGWSPPGIGERRSEWLVVRGDEGIEPKGWGKGPVLLPGFAFRDFYEVRDDAPSSERFRKTHF